MRRTLRLTAVSPHPDDAALSVGGALAHWRQRIEVTIVNVFSDQVWSCNPNVLQTEARALLLKEDAAAAGILGANVQNVGLPESGLRGFDRLSDRLSTRITAESIADAKAWLPILGEALDNSLNASQPDVLLLPLATAHRDHLLVVGAGLLWWRRGRSGIPLYLYEDLPYAINHDQVQTRLAQLRNRGISLRKHRLTVGSGLEAKRASIEQYKSQLRRRDVDAVMRHGLERGQGLLTEQVWRVTPPEGWWR